MIDWDNIDSVPAREWNQFDEADKAYIKANYADDYAKYFSQFTLNCTFRLEPENLWSFYGFSPSRALRESRRSQPGRLWRARWIGNWSLLEGAVRRPAHPP